MVNLIQNQLITDFSRDLLVQLSPQELPSFRATSEAYFKNPEKTLASQGGKDEMLGFGTAEAVTLLAPVILAVSTEVVNFLSEEVQKSFKEESSGLVSEMVKKLFTKFRSEEAEKEPPPLTVEQLTQVREIALKKARLLKLSEARAKLLADAVVGSLATVSK